MTEVDARGEQGSGRRLLPTVFVGFLSDDETQTGTGRVTDEVDFVVLPGF